MKSLQLPHRAGPIYPVLQIRKVRFRESMLSPGFIALVSLCSQTSLSLPSPSSLPLSESECPTEHSLLSTNLCLLGVAGKELNMGPSCSFTRPSLSCCFFNLILIALIFKSSSSGCFSPSGRRLYPFYSQEMKRERNKVTCSKSKTLVDE